MMRGAKSTLILLAVLVGLVAYIYFVDAKKPAASETGEKKDKVFSVDAQKIDEVTVRTSSATAALKKSGGTWQLTAPVSAKADESEMSGITTNLASVEIQRVVDANPSSLKDYGLDAPRVDVAFKAAGEKNFRHLLVGDKTPTGGDLYAKLPSDTKVFLIPGYMETTFNRTPFDLRDKTVLSFERDKVDTIDISTASSAVVMTRAAGEWSLKKPVQARADYGTIEGLIGRLQSAQMKSLAATEVTDLKTYGLDAPQVTATLGTGSSRASLAIGKPAAEGSVYARDLSRPMVFTVETALADELKKPPSEFRRKDIFEFRAFNATRIEITRADQPIAFEKVKGSGKDAQDKWRELAPAAKDVDASKMDALLSKLTGLRAQSFAEPKTATGVDSPVATIVAHFDEGKRQERVTFGRSASDVYAARSDEPGAAKVDANEFEEAMKALDALK